LVASTTTINVFFEVNTDSFSFKVGYYMSLSMSSEIHTISVFSIASVEGFHTTIDFAIPYRINELFSSCFYSFKIGDKIEGWVQMRLSDLNYIFFFTCIGLISFRSMILGMNKILSHRKNVFFFTQQKQFEHLPSQEEFEHLAITHSNFVFQIFCSD